MITTLTGSNDYARQQTLHQLTTGFVKQYSDFGLEKYDGESVDVQRLPSILQAMPFLADRRLVILENPSAQSEVQELLETLLSAVSEATDLIIVEPKLDKRTTYYKKLQKQTDFKVFEALDTNRLATWLVGQAQQHQASLSSADARYLVERVGSDQMRLASELNKLIDYQLAISRQAIDLMTDPTPQSSVFDLLDAALRGDIQKTLQLYQEQRQQKVEPLAILALLGWQLHILAIIKTAGDRSPSQIASQAKLNPFVVSKSQAIARQIPMDRLKDWIQRASRLDIKLKRQTIDSDEALQQYLLSLN